MNKSMINNRFLEETVFAIADGYCVINLTKNYVPGVMYQVIDGRQYNLNEQLGPAGRFQSAESGGCLGINDTEGGSFRLFEGIRQRTAFEAF